MWCFAIVRKLIQSCALERASWQMTIIVKTRVLTAKKNKLLETIKRINSKCPLFKWDGHMVEF